jgi:hypothetical protein
MLTYGVQPIVTLLVGYYANSVGVDVAIALNGAVMVVGSLVIGAGGLKFGSL